jgi:hypothetical protein
MKNTILTILLFISLNSVGQTILKDTRIKNRKSDSKFRRNI